MANPFLGQIMLCPYNFAPNGWAFCQGQLLSIPQNTALFSLIGTYYGGNGINTFALPDLQGRVPVSQGQAPGLSYYDIGENGGVETISLTTQQVPSHNHLVNVDGTPERGAEPATSPVNNYFGGNKSQQFYASPSNVTQQLNAASISPVSGGLPHENRMPYLVLNWCISLQGIYPSRG
jgi:microcystin-dependent protein